MSQVPYRLRYAARPYRQVYDGLSACMENNPLAKARGLFLRIGRQTVA